MGAVQPLGDTESRGAFRPRPLSVLHVVAPAEVGGLESVVRLLATGQRNAGNRVRVAAILNADDEARRFREGLEVGGVAVSPMILPGRSYLRERAEFDRLCRQVRPDIVHTHGYRPDIIDGGVARSLGIPTVTTVHGFTGGGLRNRCYEWAQQRSFRAFDAVVAVSAPLMHQLSRAGVRAGRLHLAANAYEGGRPESRAVARQALGLTDDAFVVGWVGRLTREKGADLLVDALARPEMPGDAKAAIIGAGPELSREEARSRSLGLVSRIGWHGLVPDAARLYRAFDVFVLSSRTEGTPIALFEAMAAGVPIVATRVGGVPNVVSSAEALLVDSENPGAIAAAVATVRSDPGAAARRSKAATAMLRERFGLPSWLERYDRIYRDLTSISSVRHTA